MSKDKCTQTQCVYNNTQMCPECDDCGATANIINDSCVNCWNCLKDEGYVRKGKPKFMKQDQKQKIVMEVKNEI